eukprot:scaffold174635_cov17-Tisochrysis_lutea.AAC.2
MLNISEKPRRKQQAHDAAGPFLCPFVLKTQAGMLRSIWQLILKFAFADVLVNLFDYSVCLCSGNCDAMQSECKG